MIQFDRIVECALSELNKVGVEAKGLTITFDIKKDASSNENKAEIQIYNFNETNRNWIDKAEYHKQSPIMVLLKAGYHNYAKQIFFGDVKQASSKKEGSDWITYISGSDGNTKNFSAKVSKSFKEQSTLSQAINFLVNELDFPKKMIKDIPDVTYKKGLSISGFAKDELDILCRAYDLQWFIDDGTLVVIPQITDTGETAISIRAETGLIGSPSKNEKGVDVTCLLNGDFKIGRKVQLESVLFPKANYKIVEVSHKGNSREGDFYSKLLLQNL